MPVDLSQYDLEFPVEYPVKLIGLDQDDFFELAFSLLSKHITGLSRSDLSERKSDNNKYLSVSTTFVAENRQQVQALYDDVAAEKRILIAF